MAFQYAKLGMAALMAVPAMAAPMPQNVVTVFTTAQAAVATHMVYVDQNGNTIAGPAHQAQPTQAQATQAPAPSAAAPSSAASAVSIENVKPSSKQSFAPAPISHAASSSSKAAPSPTTPASSNPSGGTSTGGKKGLVYTKNAQALAQATQIASSSNGAITWMYDWEGYPFINGQGSNSYEVSGVEFVPMLHSNDPMFIQAWKSVSPAPQGKGAKHALFLNEPDNSQFACDPNTAASLYTSTYAPGAPNALLGGPATTGGTGAPWLKKFLGACSSCKIDFMPFHYYSSSTDLSGFKAAVQEIHQISGKPMWITEFGLTAVRDGGNFSQQQRADFIKAASQWMDSQDYIQRYAPYQVSTDGSADSITAGNAIAQAYVSS